MSVEVAMPQMGESITEGTVSKWLKQVGDMIEKDELLLEISTDKVDAEVPAPSGGVLLEIRANEGETVEVGSVVGVIGEKSEVGNGSQPPAEVVETPKVEEIKAEPVKEVAETATASAAEQNPQSQISNPQSSEATEVVMPQMGESITEG
ncbi:MAG: hypothetical protein M3Q78_02900, partial [Acidobacteriota bacterium]|nr:hypothetical protein [Acidobacteriota bacterium]